MMEDTMGGDTNTLMRNNGNDDNDNDNDNNKNDGLVIAIIDFPKGGTFGLDGQNIILKTNNNNSGFIGVKDVPSNNTFHLVTCNSNGGTNKNDNNNDNSNNNNNNNNTVNTAVTVGFVIFGDGGRRSNNNSLNDVDVHDHHHLIRRYDPQTEEVASNEISAVDEITKRNLIQQIPRMSLDPSRSSSVLHYNQIIGSNNNKIWNEQTRYINESSELLLTTIRGLLSGNKIVPGCYDPENEIEIEIEEEEVDDEDTTKKTTQKKKKKTTTTKIVDGRSLTYPPIPVIDRKLSLAAHATKHTGTKRFLSRLHPSERTRLFLLSSSSSTSTSSATATSSSSSSSNNNTNNSSTNFIWLERILCDYYHNSWKALLGDLQLSYLLFLHLGCYSSLDHWKDLLAMLSLAVQQQHMQVGGGGGSNDNTNYNSSRSSSSSRQHDELYHGLLRLLPYQLSSMIDPEFLEDIDSIEGDGNFLLPTLIRLLNYYENNVNFSYDDDEDDDEEEDYDLLSKFRHVLSSKFPRTFSSLMVGPNITRIMEDEDAPVDETNINMDIGMSDYDDDDDGPVVVSSEEIEASFARSSSSFVTPITTTTETMENIHVLRKEYPLLAAAIMPNEDVLMTCARALDEKGDVSLVREAAAYLQQVEQYH
jgi:hypothetical protein